MTAERRTWPFRVALPLVVVAGAAAMLVAGLRDSPDDPAGTGSAADTDTAPLAVEATDARHFDDLESLTRASDLVVTGRVEATARGRLVGDPGDGAVVSRFVTLAVDDLLWTAVDRPPEHLVVEEEGWLSDGTPIAVNGLAPSAAGDEGMWFLDMVETSDGATFVVVNEQGRYLDEDGRTVGADRADPLIEQIEALAYDDAVASVRRVAQP